MKRICTCNQCGTETTPNKWRPLGWIKVEIFYTNGGKQVRYTCERCRQINQSKPSPSEAPSA